jgi:hypothetical protein
MKWSLLTATVLIVLTGSGQPQAGTALQLTSLSSPKMSVGDVAAHLVCQSDSQISATLQTIKFGQTYSDQQRSVTALREVAKRSPTCRSQIILALISAMDKSQIDLLADRPTFYLWHYGTRLLADLKAVEAIDFLTAHFDLDDGTPFPLSHHPALVAVIEMGEIAIPKLELLLKQNREASMRQYVVFCLAQIGGPSAKKALKAVLGSETDSCVLASTRASLSAFNNKTLPNHITSKDRTRWYSTFLCDGNLRSQKQGSPPF